MICKPRMEAFFNSPPYVVGGGGIGFTLGGILFCLLGVHFFKAMILTVVIGVIATIVLQNCSYRTQQIVALLSWLPMILICGGILLFFGLAVLWAMWTI